MLMIPALAWIQLSNIDIAIQNFFFDVATQNWLVDKDEIVKKIIFYKGPKMLLGVVIVGLLAMLIFHQKLKLSAKKYHKILLTLLGLILIPLVVGNIKKFTNVYCPCQLEIYDGDKPYIKIFDHYPEGFVAPKKGKCFPGGHSVTGFALLILFFVFEKKSHKILALAAGVLLGWVLGLYQMMKGVHFFGDTLISMLCCFFVAALISKVLNAKKYANSAH